MGLAFWLTVQAGGKRIPIPLIVVLPLLLLLDVLALLFVVPYGVLKKEPLLLRIGLGFFFSRLVLALIAFGSGFRICVREGEDIVRIFEGWRY